MIETFKNELEQDEVKRQGVKALAEVNEYMYNQLKEHGMAVKSARSIAGAFFDVSGEQTVLSRPDTTTQSDSETVMRNTQTDVGKRFESADSQSFKDDLSFSSEDDKNR